MRRFAVKRKIPTHQLIIAAALGVLGGIYIWKPIFEKAAAKRAEEAATKSTVQPEPPAS